MRDGLEIGYRQIDTARACDNERDVGRGIAVRVSNFSVGLLRQAIENAPVICDQVESPPFLHQHPLLERARENEVLVTEVLVTAYSPLAHGRMPDDQTLRWIGESRRENFEVFDFDLGQPERDEIDLLPTDVRTANPPWAPDWNA
jgi:diketogulonate reductase-like aldo/keto reductase